MAQPSRGIALAVVSGAIVLIVAMLLLPGGLLLATAAGGLGRVFEAARTPLILLILIGLFATPAAAVAMAFAAYQPRVPASVPWVFAVLPWIVGILGTIRGVGQVFEAVANVNPEDKTLIAMAGTAEALGPRMLGAWGSASLMAGCAAGLLIAALRARLHARGDLRELIAGALAAGVFAIHAAAAAFESSKLAVAIESAALRPEEEHSTVLESLARHISTAHHAALGSLIAAGIFVAGWAALALHRRSAIAGVSAGLAALLVFGTSAFDRTALERPRDEAAAQSAPRVPAEGFVLPRAYSPRTTLPPVAFATTTGFLFRDSPLIPWHDRGVLGPRLAELHRDFVEHDAFSDELNERPFPLALDARLPPETLRDLLRALAAAGFHGVTLPVAAPEAGLDAAALREIDPLLAWSPPSDAGVAFQLDPELAEDDKAGLAVGILQGESLRITTNDGEELRIPLHGPPAGEELSHRLVLMAIPQDVPQLVALVLAVERVGSQVLFTFRDADKAAGLPDAEEEDGDED